MERMGRELPMKYWHIVTPRLMSIPSIGGKNKSLIQSFMYVGLVISAIWSISHDFLVFWLASCYIFLLSIMPSFFFINALISFPSNQSQWVPTPGNLYDSSLPMQFILWTGRILTYFWSLGVYVHICPSHWTLFQVY